MHEHGTASAAQHTSRLISRTGCQVRPTPVLEWDPPLQLSFSILQVATEIHLVPLLPSEELFNTGHIYFSPRIHILQGAFISLMRKSLARKILFIFCSKYSYFAMLRKACADFILLLAWALLSSLMSKRWTTLVYYLFSLDRSLLILSRRIFIYYAPTAPMLIS